jgi:uncharacterized protein (TIGR01777 family)
MPVPRRQLFEWFTREGAFERLAPPFVHLSGIRREGGLEVGARTTVEMRMGPLRRRFMAEHTAYEEGARFVDEQVEGPFARFVNEHRMLEGPEGRSVLEDEIDYALPGGRLGDLLGEGLVRRTLEAVFGYRHALLQADLARHRRFESRPRLHVAITGASGLIGSALAPFLTTGGHRVTPVPHRMLGSAELGGVLQGTDAVVHLAGAPIAEGRWTAAKRAQIRDSRVKGTRALCEALARLQPKPKVLVSGSAVGIYGDRGGETLIETSPSGDSFLADVCREWEAATLPAREAGIRVVLLRTGIVLTPRGGALKSLLPPFQAGVGGPVGTGTQFMSWISIEDELGLIHWALMNETVEGPLNATAPTPVTSAEFANALGTVLRRPALLPVPGKALSLLLGAQKARELLLGGQKVLPEAALQGGFTFLHPELIGALRFVLGRPAHPAQGGA